VLFAAKVRPERDLNPNCEPARDARRTAVWFKSAELVSPTLGSLGARRLAHQL